MKLLEVGKHCRLHFAIALTLRKDWRGPKLGMIAHKLDRSDIDDPHAFVSVGCVPIAVSALYRLNTDRTHVPLFNFGRPWYRYRCGQTGEWVTLDPRTLEVVA